MKRSTRIDMERGLLVDATGNSTHVPTMPKVDTRWDFMETPIGVGSFKVRFTINDIVAGSGANVVKIIGSCTDIGDWNTTGRGLAGWMLYFEKSNMLLKFWIGSWGGVDGGYAGADTDITLVPGITYETTVIKIGLTFRFYNNTVPPSVLNHWSYLTVIPTNNPVTLGAGVHQGSVQRSIITYYGIVAFNTEIDRKAGSTYTGYIDAMYNNGNWIPDVLHQYVIAHYTMQDTDQGLVMFDNVADYNPAKTPVLYPIGITGTGWTTGFYGATAAWTFSGGEGSISGDSITGTVNKDDAFIVGHKYRVTYTIVSSSGGWSFYPLMNGSAMGPITSAPGTYVVEGTATDSGYVRMIHLWLNAAGVGSMVVKDIKVESITSPVLANVPLELIGYTAPIPLKDIVTKGDAVIGLSGSNIVNNGDFASGGSGWEQGYTAGWIFSNGKVTSPAGSGAMYQSSTLKVSTTYKVTYKIDSVSSGGDLLIRLGYHSGGSGAGALRTTPGIYTEYITTYSSISDNYIYINTHENCTIDYITVQEFIPPISKAILSPNYDVQNPIFLPRTGIDNGTDAFSLMVQYYLDRDIPESSYPYNYIHDLICEGGSGGVGLSIRMIYFRVYLSTSYLTAANDADWARITKKGFHTIIFNRHDDPLKVSLIHNNVQIDLTHAYQGQPVNTIAAGTTPMNLRNITTHEHYKVYGPSFADVNNYLIACGLKKGVIGLREAAELHANSRNATPKDVANWIFYSHYDDVSSPTIADLSGHGRTSTHPYTGSYIDPTSPNYVIKNLDILRQQTEPQFWVNTQEPILTPTLTSNTVYTITGLIDTSVSLLGDEYFMSLNNVFRLYRTGGASDFLLYNLVDGTLHHFASDIPNNTKTLFTVRVNGNNITVYTDSTPQVNIISTGSPTFTLSGGYFSPLGNNGTPTYSSNMKLFRFAVLNEDVSTTVLGKIWNGTVYNSPELAGAQVAEYYKALPKLGLIEIK